MVLLVKINLVKWLILSFNATLARRLSCNSFSYCSILASSLWDSSIFARNNSISRLYFCNNALSSWCVFLEAVCVDTFLSLHANLRVFMDSSKLFWFGVIVQITAIFELPDKEFWRIRVSLLSRYGIWFPWFSVNLEITFPSVRSDLLMNDPSFLLSRLLENFSLPAKSIRLR